LIHPYLQAKQPALLPPHPPLPVSRDALQYNFILDLLIHTTINAKPMSNDGYFNPEDLKRFGEITRYQKTLGKKYFDYYNEVFKEGALTVREKALIALAVAHVVQCPYCIDAYTEECLKNGADEEEMMEAIHVAAAIRSGASLVFGVQMINHLEKKTM